MKKIISISLAILLMLGNVGFTYGTHFCMGRAVKSELMIGHDHLDCGMGMMDQTSPEDDLMHFDNPDCCDNDYISVETDEQFNKSTSVASMNVFVAAVAQFLYLVDFNAIQEPIAAIDPSPPIIDPDFQVMHQVFLI